MNASKKNRVKFASKVQETEYETRDFDEGAQDDFSDEYESEPECQSVTQSNRKRSHTERDHSSDEEEETDSNEPLITKEMKLAPKYQNMSLAELMQQQSAQVSRKVVSTAAANRNIAAKSKNPNSKKSSTNKTNEKKLKEQLNSKDAPTEEPIYKTPKSYGQISERKKQKMESKKPIARDPRFDDLSGVLNEDFFDEKYKFIEELKESEMGMLSRELRGEKDEDRRELLSRAMQRLREQKRVKQRRQAKREVMSAHLDEQIAAVESGGRHNWLRPEEMQRRVKSNLVSKGLERETSKKVRNKERRQTGKARKLIPDRR